MRGSVVMALVSLISVMIIMWPLVMAVISVLNHLYHFVMAVLNHLYHFVMAVLKHLYLVVMALLSFFFTYFSFQIKNFLWEKLKPSLQRFVETLLVKTKLKSPITAATLLSVQLLPATPIEFGREEFESRLQKALNFLRDDSQGVLGICGMGGVGKTTLLEHINNTLAKNSSSFGFHVVVLVTASRECTTEKIQNQIAKKLGLSRGETADIFNYFNNKSFAILLDDMWGDLDLKKVGIPLPLGMVGDYRRKLILTSRLESVCNNMGENYICRARPSARSRPAAQIKVDCLGREDARLLFRRRVGEAVIGPNLTIWKLADQVADLCGGLPIALNAVGRAMAGTREVEVWEGAVDELHKSKSNFFETREEIAGTEGNPLPLLKFSYDHLKGPEKKECFLHCALWPEDFEIDTDELIRCWIGHGLLGEFDNLNEAYRKGHTVIDSLQKACLLEKVALAYYVFGSRNQLVKLHDLIRDMALWIACDCGVNKNKWIVLAGQRLQEAPRDQRLWTEAHKISLMFNQIRSLPSDIQNSPNLTTLMLQENHYLGVGLRMSKSFNSLKYLDISGCLWLKCLPTEICELTKLEYLNISKTNIRSLRPEELKALVNLKYLIARDNLIDSRVSPELLSNLVSLIELDLFKSHYNIFSSSVIDNLDCLEGRLKGLGITVTTISNLQKLIQLSGIPITSLCLEGMEDLGSSLKLLSLDFLGSQHICSNLKQLILSPFRGSVEEVVIEGKHQLNIEKLHLFATGLKEIKWKGVEPRDVLHKLRELKVSKYFALKSIEWVMYLPCLEILELEQCEEMEQMLGEEAGASGTKQEEEDRPTFPSLRCLKILHMPKLSSICHRPLTFPSLEVLYIYGCKQLNKLPFHSRSSCPKLRDIQCDEATKKGIDLEENMRPILEPLIKIKDYQMVKIIKWICDDKDHSQLVWSAATMKAGW